MTRHWLRSSVQLVLDSTRAKFRLVLYLRLRAPWKTHTHRTWLLFLPVQRKEHDWEVSRKLQQERGVGCVRGSKKKKNKKTCLEFPLHAWWNLEKLLVYKSHSWERERETEAMILQSNGRIWRQKKNQFKQIVRHCIWSWMLLTKTEEGNTSFSSFRPMFSYLFCIWWKFWPVLDYQTQSNIKFNQNTK